MLTLKNLYYSNDNQNLTIDSLSLAQGQSLLVVGNNASGKSLLVRILTGAITDFQGLVQLPSTVANLSAEREQAILAYDRRHNNSDYMAGGIDWGRTAKQIINPKNSGMAHSDRFNRVVDLLDIQKLLDQPFKLLSTGEIRKVLMASALLLEPELLILDEPYTGLDMASQQHLTHILTQLVRSGISIVLFDFYRPALPDSINTLMCLDSGKVACYGDRASVLSSQQWRQLNTASYTLPHDLPDGMNTPEIDRSTPLIRVSNLSLAFYQTPIFQHLDWQVNYGEHWRIRGPNGCGKSTLLAMISGDSTKAYGQSIWLLGNKRGSGESIWDIKRHYGIVSASLHRDYRASTTLLETVLSGFFDSTGLYDTPSQKQLNVARQWLVLLGMEQQQTGLFNQLSYGEQRLVLIARAMVKLPLILMLDEPCQGLDNANRSRVLALVDYIAQHSQTHVLFVSHDQRDQLSCLTHELEFFSQGNCYSTGVSRLCKS